MLDGFKSCKVIQKIDHSPFHKGLSINFMTMVYIHYNNLINCMAKLIGSFLHGWYKNWHLKIMLADIDRVGQK